MHPNPIFRNTPDARAIQLVRDRAFGQLTIHLDGQIVAAHVPVLLAPDATSIDMHLVRSNPIARALTEPREALLAVTGPDGYVSPDWYGAEDQVPTWNYIAVHLTGRLEPLPEDASVPMDTTRTSSPYFSPNSACAPIARASSGVMMRVSTGAFWRM